MRQWSAKAIAGGVRRRVGEVLMKHLDSAEQVDALFLDALGWPYPLSWRVEGNMALYFTPI